MLHGDPLQSQKQPAGQGEPQAPELRWGLLQMLLRPCGPWTNQPARPCLPVVPGPWGCPGPLCSHILAPGSCTFIFPPSLQGGERRLMFMEPSTGCYASWIQRTLLVWFIGADCSAVGSFMSSSVELKVYKCGVRLARLKAGKGRHQGLVVVCARALGPLCPGGRCPRW